MRFQIQHVHTVSPGHVDWFDPARRVAQLAEPTCCTCAALNRRPGSRLAVAATRTTVPAEPPATASGKSGRSACPAAARCRRLCQGLSNAEIAEALCVSELTVRSHIGRIFVKLDCATVPRRS